MGNWGWIGGAAPYDLRPSHEPPQLSQHATPVAAGLTATLESAMSGLEPQCILVRELLRQAAEVLAQERELTSAAGRACVYELAQAGKLSLADAAAVVMSGERPATTPTPGPCEVTARGQHLG